MSARAALGITGACAVSFAGAFAVGSTTRDAAAPRPAPAAAVAAADGLPGLRATRARHAAAHSPARAVVRRSPALTRRPVRAVAPVTRPVSAPAPAAKPKPVPSRPVTTNRRPATSAPVSTARKPSVTFFDEGD
jgi:hypothetical protein